MSKRGKKEWKVGDHAKLRKVTWRFIDGVVHLTDDTGPIISIAGTTKGHNNVHKYAINMKHSICYTDKPLTP